MAKPSQPAARERLTAGNKLYRLREFAKAVEEYKAGALIEDVPVFHYNLGQCYRQLDRFEDAIWHYERFVERGKPTGELRGGVDAFLTQLKNELQRKAATPPPVVPDPEPAAPPGLMAPKVVQVRVPGEPLHRDQLGWGITAVGVVAIGAGGWLLFDAKGIEDGANVQAAQSERERLGDRASSRRLVGSIVGGVGVGFLVTGIVKLAMSPPDREETVTTSFGVGLTSDSIFVTGRF
ncbi:MAG: hypothetical protein H0T42_02610 [Deltaproteobacteria bacterium]|nr:hypothetical protein [Deltaproteobacteria bacterium]